MEHFFVADTNLFFECKRLEDIDWLDLGCDPIVIALTKPVLGEIDKHKKAGGRTKRRALKVSQRIRTMLESSQAEEVINAASPKVVLRLLSTVKPDPDLAEDLDYEVDDDRFVGIVSTLSNNNQSVSFLTDDSLAASTAQVVGVPFQLIPESWKRPPEQTTEAKKIKELEQDIATYRSQEPNIEIRDASVDGTQTRVEKSVPRALKQQEVETLVDKLRAKHPMKEEYSLPEARTLADGTQITYEAPEADEVTEYQTKAYPNWVKECTDIFSNLHDKYLHPEPLVQLIIGVRNDGTRPASKMRVIFEAQGQVLIRRVKNRDDEAVDTGESLPANLPAPPVPPAIEKIKTRPESASAQGMDLADLGFNSGAKGFPNIKDLAAFNDISALTQSRQNYLDHSLLNAPIVRDVPTPSNPEQFYYQEWPLDELISEGALTCDLFRHHRDEELFEFEVLFHPDEDLTGAVLCSVHAENLTKPVEFRVSVSRKIVEYDLVPTAEKMIEDCCDSNKIMSLF